MEDDNNRFKTGIDLRGSVVAAAALFATIGGFLFYPKDSYPSYLTGCLFWIGLTLGCLPLVMLHQLTGGRWGLILRPFFRCGLATLPLMTLLVIPIFFGFKYLYPWAGLPVTHGAEVLRERTAYLNAPSVIARAILAILLWLILAWVLVWRRDPAKSVDGAPRLQLISGIGLVLFAVITSFAIIDWLMAIEPTWYSSIFPAIILSGQVLCALAMAIFLSVRRFGAPPVDSAVLNQIGNLLLTFVLLWAYLSVSQLIIIYAGDLPHEISWYQHRTRAGWLWVALLLVAFQFFLPFALLLFRGVKQSPRILTMISFMVLTMQAIAMFWYTAPSFHHAFRVTWTDPVAFVGIGAAWVTIFKWRMHRETQPASNTL